MALLEEISQEAMSSHEEDITAAVTVSKHVVFCRDRLGTSENTVGTVGTNALELFRPPLEGWSLRSLQYFHWSLAGPYKKPYVLKRQDASRF